MYSRFDRNLVKNVDLAPSRRWDLPGGRLPTVAEIIDVGHLLEVYEQLHRHGGPGAGVDRVTYRHLGRRDFADVARERNKVIHEGRWRPDPVRPHSIPKANGKRRTLHLPTVMDRIYFSALAEAMSPVFEKFFSKYSYGFPSGKPHLAVHDTLVPGCFRSGRARSWGDGGAGEIAARSGSGGR